jgi:hypothetical protein
MTRIPRPAAIIFGAPRSGTTSLWRYLVQHPDIAASHVKELNFFVADDRDPAIYDTNFATQGAVTLEASPVYFHEHTSVAPRLGKDLPQARLACVLREPARRLVAAYRSERDWHSRVVPGMTFTRYAEIVANGEDPAPINPADPVAAAYVRDCSKVGIYADVLGHYFEFFDPSAIKIQFLDRLETDPEAVVRVCCEHFGVDPARLPTIAYTVENQGVNVRNLKLFHALRRVNVMLEPMLNRAPTVRHFLKRVHHAINGAQQDLHAEDEARGVAILREWYAPYNRRFAALLDEYYPTLERPEWLGRVDKRDSHLP